MDEGSPMSEFICTCPWTPERMWLSAVSCGYGGGYEPGSQQEFDPGCPRHGDGTTSDRAVCPECGDLSHVIEVGVEASAWPQPERDYLVTRLTCGHEITAEIGR